MSSGAVFPAYIAALRAGNRQRAFAVVDQAREAGMDLRGLYIGVFQPALYEVGRLWQDGVLSVAQEHLATAITQAAMARLYHSLFAQRPISDGPTLLAACVESERHEVGLRMVCDLAELEGWDTIYLGATVPSADLAAMAAERQPRILALSASMDHQLPKLAEMIASVRQATSEQQPAVLVGGRAFHQDPTLAGQLGADATARDAVVAIEQLSLWRDGHG